jgi:O-antigen/teichoic acid export membrane protein
LGLGLSLFSKEVLIFFTTPEYIPSHKIVFLIILFYSFNGMASIVSIGVHLLKKSIVITISTIVSSIMNVILCILLIPFFGIMGAAFAIMVGSLINVIILFSINQKIYNTPFHKKKICGIFLLFLAIVLISQEIQIDEIIYSLLFKSILILIFIGGLFKIKMITQREVSFLKEIFRKYYSIIG